MYVHRNSYVQNNTVPYVEVFWPAAGSLAVALDYPAADCGVGCSRFLRIPPLVLVRDVACHSAACFEVMSPPPIPKG